MTELQMSDEVKQFIKGLNRLVVLYETHPELPVPYLGDIYLFAQDREQLVRFTKSIAHLKPEKAANETYYDLTAKLSTNVTLKAVIERHKVCERIQTGTKLVEVPARPAEPARVEEQPVYEWKCAEALLK